MLEREFQGYVIDTARRFGWRVWHTPMPVQRIRGGDYVPDPRGAGVPDLILMHPDPPRLIFAEVKVKTPLSEAQKEFLRMATAVAQDVRDFAAAADVRSQATIGVYTWRPGDEDQIEAVLRSKVMVA